MDSRRRKGILEEFRRMGRLDNRAGALYRRVYAAFGLSPCATWVFYFLLASEDGLSQRDMAELTMFPRQTVNTAVSRLAGEGLLELSHEAGTRNEKRVRLTAAGRALAERTSGRLLRAEIRATAAFGARDTSAYTRLRERYLGLLQREFEGDFLAEAEAGG